MQQTEGFQGWLWEPAYLGADRRGEAGASATWLALGACVGERELPWQPGSSSGVGVDPLPAGSQGDLLAMQCQVPNHRLQAVMVCGVCVCAYKKQD